MGTVKPTYIKKLGKQLLREVNEFTDDFDVNKKIVDEHTNIETVKAIRPIIPIKIEEVRIAIKIPAAYSGRVYEIKKNYNVTKEEWEGDGSFIALLRVPAGMRDELFSFFEWNNKRGSSNEDCEVKKYV